MSWNHDLDLWVSDSSTQAFSTANHYLAGTQPLPGVICDTMVVALSSKISAHTRLRRLSSLPQASAVVTASKVGWGVVETAAQGDCGIDAMAIHARRERTEAVWQDVRDDLTGAIVSVIEDEDWQDAFQACQEGRAGASQVPVGKLPPPTPSALVASSASVAPPASVTAWTADEFFNVESFQMMRAVAASVGTSACAPSSPPPWPPLSSPPPLPPPSSPPPLSPPLSPQPLLAPLGNSADVTQAASVSDTSALACATSASVSEAVAVIVEHVAAVEDKSSDKPWIPFHEHLRTMADNDERNKLTTDYFRYTEAEAIYNAKHPRPKTRKIEDPRREYRGTKRRHALAMGEASEAWRKTPQGASSKAVLKEFSVTNGALQNDILFDVLGCCGCRDLPTGVVTHVWLAWFVLRCSV